MKLTEALLCISETKSIKVIIEQKAYTKQELINEVTYDKSNNFDLTLDINNNWIITQDNKPFAFLV
jgi:hypothetical protein